MHRVGMRFGFGRLFAVGMGKVRIRGRARLRPRPWVGRGLGFVPRLQFQRESGEGLHLKGRSREARFCCCAALWVKDKRANMRRRFVPGMR